VTPELLIMVKRAMSLLTIEPYRQLVMP